MRKNRYHLYLTLPMLCCYSLSIALARFAVTESIYLSLWFMGVFLNFIGAALLWKPGLFNEFEMLIDKNVQLTPSKKKILASFYSAPFCGTIVFWMFGITHTKAFNTAVVMVIIVAVVLILFIFVQSKLFRRELQNKDVLIEKIRNGKGNLFTYIRLATVIGADQLWSRSQLTQRWTLGFGLGIAMAAPYLSVLFGAGVSSFMNYGKWLYQTYGVPKIVTFTPTALIFFFLMFAPIAAIFTLIAALYIEFTEKESAKAELRAAHDMQMGLMPKEDPKVEGYDISGLCLPANEVGGDFFDYVWLDDAKNLLGIAVADVSGKAMKAAITAVMTSGMVYNEVRSNESPRTILRKINRPMYLKTDRQVFTALSFVVIDLPKKKLTLSNAGQMMPLLRRGNALQSLKVEGPRLPLGVKEEVEYNEISLKLKKGDLLFLFTDGIVEAKNSGEELWGFERMEEAVRNLPQTMTAKEIGETLVAEANKFAGTAKQHDDMTVVVVKVEDNV